jgi:hypothetical protein
MPTISIDAILHPAAPAPVMPTWLVGAELYLSAPSIGCVPADSIADVMASEHEDLGSCLLCLGSIGRLNHFHEQNPEPDPCRDDRDTRPSPYRQGR